MIVRIKMNAILTTDKTKEMKSRILKTVGLIAAMVSCIGMTAFAAPSPASFYSCYSCKQRNRYRR